MNIEDRGQSGEDGQMSPASLTLGERGQIAGSGHQSASMHSGMNNEDVADNPSRTAGIRQPDNRETTDISHFDRQTDRHTDRQTDRQTHRQTD